MDMLYLPKDYKKNDCRYRSKDRIRKKGIEMSSTNNPESIIATVIRFIGKAKWPIFVFVSILLNYFAIRNVVFLSKDMIYGDNSVRLLAPSPIYSPVRVPETVISSKYQAENRLGVDFAQIYFPAQGVSSLENAYIRQETLDPWKRASRYAPLILDLCSKTLCKLDYGYASFGNILIQLLLFFIMVYLAFRLLEIKEYFLPAFVFMETSLFLTPVGLLWFEYGQFSLYVAISYLLLLSGMIKKNNVLFMFSAIFAFIKWTSLPLIFVVLAVYILSSKSKKDVQHNIITASIFGLVFALLLLPLINVNVPFIRGLIEQETYRYPLGLSLAIFVPKPVVKSLPFALIIIGYFVARINKNNFVDIFPFLTGAAIILLLYPTVAFDYSVPTILGFIPLMIFWAKHLAPNQRRGGTLVLLLFLLFIILASFSTRLTGSIFAVVIIYLTFSITLMISPIIFAKCFEKSASQIIASGK